MSRSPFVFSACAAFALVACGLDVNGTSIGETPGDDGGLVLPGTEAGTLRDASGGSDGASQSDGGGNVDGGGNADASSVDSGPAPCTPNNSVSCFALPSGWSVVDFAPGSRSAPCPAPFASQSDVEEGPTPGAACRCDQCSITTQPSCVNGAITSSYDSDMLRLCLLPGSTLANNPGGGCNVGQYNLAPDVKLTPPAASGGACSATLSKHKEVFTFAAQGRACAAANDAAAGCSNGVCAPPAASAPFATCIASPGIQAACPAGPFNVKHVVGTDVTFDCGATTCACNVTAQCSGTVSFYGDAACQSPNPAVLTADDSCRGTNTPPVGGPSYGSYKYTAAPSNVACSNVAPAPPSNVQLVGATTICCAH